MVVVKLNQESLVELKSLLKEVFGMSNSDSYASINGDAAMFGQSGERGHKNMALLRAYDTGDATQYDLLIKPAGDHRWTLESRGESLFEAAKLISEKVVK